jgi:single-strand DNA-binding protein
MANHDYNKVLLIGHIGDAPSYSDKGKSPCAWVSLATHKQFQQGDEQVNQVHWHPLVFFGKLATIAQQLLYKGAKVFVEGELMVTQRQTKEGHPYSFTQVNVREFRFLSSTDSKSSISSPAPDSDGTTQEDPLF